MTVVMSGDILAFIFILTQFVLCILYRQGKSHRLSNEVEMRERFFRFKHEYLGYVNLLNLPLGTGAVKMSDLVSLFIDQLVHGFVQNCNGCSEFFCMQ